MRILSLKWKYLFTTLVAFGILITNYSSAKCIQSQPCGKWCDPKEEFDLSLYSGYLYGWSKELVFTGDMFFPPMRKISQLDWSIRNLWVIGAKAEKRFLDNRLHLSADVWSRIAAGHAKIVDRDWTAPSDSILTDISISTNTQLKTAFGTDLQVAYDVGRLYGDSWTTTVSALVGYEYWQFFWKAFGGKFAYHLNEEPMRGEFPPELVLTYRQFFSIPYVGLGVSGRIGPWSLSCFGKYSPLVHAKARDFHALRNIHFISTFNDGHFWALGLEAEWNFWRNLCLDFKYSFERIDQIVGDDFLVDNTTGETGNFPRSAGIAHFHNFFTLGLIAEF